MANDKLNDLQILDKKGFINVYKFGISNSARNFWSFMIKINLLTNLLCKFLTD